MGRAQRKRRLIMKLTVDDIAEEKSGSGKHGIEKKDYYFASSTADTISLIF